MTIWLVHEFGCGYSLNLRAFGQEYCEGESLDRLVAQQRPCCEHYLLCLLWDISRALVHLDDRPGRPMVHLDIKPEVRLEFSCI